MCIVLSLLYSYPCPPPPPSPQNSGKGAYGLGDIMVCDAVKDVEEEVGTVQWRQRHIGRIVGRSRVYVEEDNNNNNRPQKKTKGKVVYSFLYFCVVKPWCRPLGHFCFITNVNRILSIRSMFPGNFILYKIPVNNIVKGGSGY